MKKLKYVHNMIQRLRKKINNSGKRECDICITPEYLIEHHINGRKILDFDADWNKCYICPNCHNKIHRDLIVIEGWHQTSDGYKLFWESKKEII
jgi:Zn-finger protein